MRFRMQSERTVKRWRMLRPRPIHNMSRKSAVSHAMDRSRKIRKARERRRREEERGPAQDGATGRKSP